ncbi:MAG: hypothetical protein MJ014_08020 [Methanocorpusculum sp.]|nr:hypothetical protein [Methanocorpusculum sp.]
MFPGDYRFFAERTRLPAEAGKYLDAVVATGDALAINPYAPQIHANKVGYLISPEMRRARLPWWMQHSPLIRQTRRPLQTKQMPW